MRVCTMTLRAFASAVFLCALAFAAQPARAQQTFSYPNFTTATGLTPNGSAGTAVNTSGNTVLRITPAAGDADGSVWYNTAQPLLNGFTSTFTFQFSQLGGGPPAGADGITFVIQNVPQNPLQSLGYFGGAIGYGDDDNNDNPTVGISNSLAIEFDTYANGWDPNANHVAFQSCGTGNNTQHHGTNCAGTTTSSTIAIQSALASMNILLNDGNVHTAVVNYVPPSQGVNNLTLIIDNQQVLAAPFDISTLGLTNGTAYVGFTASTGGSFEAQDILSWNFSSQVVTQPVSTSTPTTFAFSNNAGSELVHDLNFSQANTNGDLSFPLKDPTTLVIQSSNNSVDATTWPQYVYGGPLATSKLFPLVDDNTSGGDGTNGGLLVDLCYDPTLTTNPQAQTPSDANCPFVTSGTNSIGVDVTADLVSKPPIAAGTISVLAHYEPPSGNPLLPWSPSVYGANNPSTNTPNTANAACTITTGSGNQQPAPPTNCNVLDIEQSISGDQTTSSGRARNKGTFAFAYNVPIPESTVSVNGTQVNQPGINNPLSSAGLWFSAKSGQLNLSFLVNPACPPGLTCPLTSAVAAANNYFQAAPVASESFSVTGNGAGVQNTPATAPSGFNTATVQPVTFTGTVYKSSVPDGTYQLLWSAVDNVGIPEQFQTLTPYSMTANPNGTCSDGSPVPTTGACYNTSSFAAALNVDSTSPTISLTSPTATNYTSGQKVKAVYSCVDPAPTSGLASCAGPVGNGAYIDTTTTGPGTTNKTFTVTAADSAIPANTATQSVNYTVTCHYAALSVSPNSVKRPALIGVTASVSDCMPTSQNVSVKFTLTGPLGKNCANDSTVMFTTPTFTIKAGTSNSITFPFIIPNSVCAGSYTISTATIQNKVTVDTSTTTLTVK
jgi:hypothetical protein